MYNNYVPFLPFNQRYKTHPQKMKHFGTEKICLKNETKKDRPQMFQAQASEAIIEIFGLKIYFDDLLIICILLFLYQEGIHDEYLFIALILLLLS